ncbi:MAG: helix-turn-helix domain-containing protein [Flavobacteriales bacterium]
MKESIVVEMSVQELKSLILKSILEAQQTSANKISGKDPISPDLMTVHQAAKFLSLSPSTIYTKVSQGRLPFLKQTKRLYFLKDDLIEHLKASELSSKM